MRCSYSQHAAHADTHDRKVEGAARPQLQILLCPAGGGAAGSATAAAIGAPGAAQLSAGPSLEGLGLATPQASPARSPCAQPEPGAGCGDGGGGGNDGAPATNALPAEIAALVREHSLQPARVQVGGSEKVLLPPFPPREYA